MCTLIQQMKERQEYLERLLQGIKQMRETLPDGRLRIAGRAGKPLYYQVTKVDGHEVRKYLNSTKSEFVKQLCQREYLDSLISSVEQELHEINRVLKHGRLFSSDHIYRNLHPARRALVKPYLIDNDTYAEIWQKTAFPEYDYHREELIYPTRRGEMVRTKSEAWIADMYFGLGIPYKYECPLLLEGGITRHPDFTLLHKQTRKIYYHEHFGLLDDPGYRKRNMQKLDLYRKNGIYTGKNLILTHEVEGSPLNMRNLEENTIDLFGLDGTHE